MPSYESTQVCHGAAVADGRVETILEATSMTREAEVEGLPCLLCCLESLEQHLELEVRG